MFINNIDPVAFQIFSLEIRWYSLAYIFGIIFGYLIWDEVPTISTLFGSALVILSSVIIFRREIYYKKQLSVTRNE